MRAGRQPTDRPTDRLTDRPTDARHSQSSLSARWATTDPLLSNSSTKSLSRSSERVRARARAAGRHASRAAASCYMRDVNVIFFSMIIPGMITLR